MGAVWYAGAQCRPHSTASSGDAADESPGHGTRGSRYRSCTAGWDAKEEQVPRQLLRVQASDSCQRVGPRGSTEASSTSGYMHIHTSSKQASSFGPMHGVCGRHEKYDNAAASVAAA